MVEPRRTEPEIGGNELLWIMALIEGRIEALERVVEVLQEAQEALPLPAREQVTKMRSGVRPLSQPAFLLGLFQRAIVAIEDTASDLRTEVEHGLAPPAAEDFGDAGFNAIESALARLRPGRPSK